MDNSYKDRLNKRTWDILQEFALFEKQVRNRAAHSMDCHPHDFDVQPIIDLFFKNLSQFEAARQLENSLYEEMYSYAEKA